MSNVLFKGGAVCPRRARSRGGLRRPRRRGLPGDRRARPLLPPCPPLLSVGTRLAGVAEGAGPSARRALANRRQEGQASRAAHTRSPQCGKRHHGLGPITPQGQDAWLRTETTKTGGTIPLPSARKITRAIVGQRPLS